MIDRGPSFTVWAFQIVVLFSVAGCGGPDRPQTVPVSGVITFGNGPWPKSGKIFFTCVEPEPGFPLRPGVADFDRDGSFVVTSYEPGDGLVPGTYRLSIECWEVAPNFDGIPSQSVIPDRYHDPATNGIEEIVIKSSDNQRELELDIPKP